MSQFYYSKTGEDVHGPIDESDLVALYQAKSLPKTTKIRATDNEEWYPLGSVLEISQEKPKQSSFLPLFLILVLLVVGGILGSGYFYIQQKKAETQHLFDSRKKVLSLLERINSVTSMGVNYNNYTNLLVDTKPDIDAALGELPPDNFTDVAKSTAQLYVDSGNQWNKSITSDQDGRDNVSKIWTLAGLRLILLREMVDQVDPPKPDSLNSNEQEVSLKDPNYTDDDIVLKDTSTKIETSLSPQGADEVLSENGKFYIRYKNEIVNLEFPTQKEAEGRLKFLQDTMK